MAVISAHQLMDIIAGGNKIEFNIIVGTIVSLIAGRTDCFFSFFFREDKVDGLFS